VKEYERKIAKERIERLFQLAVRMSKEDLKLADRYVQLARRISLKHRVRFTKEQKLLFCKGCGGLLLPGRTARIRIRPRREPHVVITCLKCGYIRRIPIKRREKRQVST